MMNDTGFVQIYPCISGQILCLNVDKAMEQKRKGIVKTLIKTAIDLNHTVQEEMPKVAPKLSEELTKTIENAKNVSALSSLPTIIEEGIKGLNQAVKADIDHLEQKVIHARKQMQRQFLYQWIVIAIGIGLSLIFALLR